MNILYLRPFLSGEKYEPPLGLACIIAYLREYIPHLEQEVIDLDLLQWNAKKVNEEIKRRKPDIACISAFSYS